MVLVSPGTRQAAAAAADEDGAREARTGPATPPPQRDCVEAVRKKQKQTGWQSLEPNLKNAVSFQYNRLGAARLFTQYMRHHHHSSNSVSQQTVCLVPSLGYPTSVYVCVRL